MIRIFTILVAAGFTPPWAQMDDDEQQAMRATAAEIWRRVLDGLNADEDAVREALLLWIGQDVAGHWPKPGAVAALVVRGSRPQPVAEIAERQEPELELIGAAGQYSSVNSALYWDMHGRYWPQVDPATPENQASIKRLRAAGLSNSDEGAVWLIRQATAARRLLGLRMMIEQIRAEHPIPDDSIKPIIIEAMIIKGMLEPEVTRDDARVWLRERMANDAKIRAERDAEIEQRRIENERRIKEKANPVPRQASPVPQHILNRVKRPPTPNACPPTDDV